METCTKCQNKVLARGLCAHHWLEYRKSPEYTRLRRKNDPVTWRCENCGVGYNETKSHANGLCGACYQHLRAFGTFEKHRNPLNSNEHPLYRTYCHMKERCYNDNCKDYKNYGGRGIKVCDRWLGYDGFQNFIKDMGEKPDIKYSLDRVDVNGDYCPENCRWASRLTQNTNKRNSRQYTGVHWDSCSYKAEIRCNGKNYTKRFRQLKDAISWRREREKELYGTDS